MSGRRHRPHQTLRCELLSSNPSNLLTDAPQESKDVDDKLESLIPWLTKLNDSVTKSGTDCTHEEAERRDRLTRFVSYISSSSFAGSESIACRSLEDIQERSQGLQGKGRMTRALDKTRDSQKVAKLVEDLRQAIVIYQVGIGKSPRDRAEPTYFR